MMSDLVAPSSNGTHLPIQTVLDRIQAETKHFNATYWREKLLWCHVPPDSDASLWEVGIARVATIFYTPGQGAP